MTDDMEISIPVAREIASWRRVFAARKNDAEARSLLRKATADLWEILEIDSTVRPETNGLARQAVVDALQDMADSASIAPDDAQLIFAENFKAKEANGLDECDADAKPAGPKPRHQRTMYGDIKHKQRKKWVTRGLLGTGELSCMYGPPGCGKSVLAGDLAAHVAAGEPWFDRQVTQGAVLDIAAERSQIVLRRFAAIRIAHGWKRLPLQIVSGLIDLRSNKIDAELIIGYAEELKRNTSLAVRLIVIDTLSRALNGGDENSPKDMGAFVAAVTQIQEATGAHILVVHHVPHEAMRMRGHGSMLAACDATLRVEKQTASRTATLEKSNDVIEGAKLAFTLKSVELDREDDGQITSAPIVVSCDAAAHEAIKPTLSSRERLALEALANCVLDQGKPSPASFQLSADIKVVTVEAWRKALFSRGVLDPEAKNPREPFRRLKLALLGQHMIGERDNFIWMAKQGAQP